MARQEVDDDYNLVVDPMPMHGQANMYTMYSQSADVAGPDIIPMNRYHSQLNGGLDENQMEDSIIYAKAFKSVAALKAIQANGSHTCLSACHSPNHLQQYGQEVTLLPLVTTLWPHQNALNMQNMVRFVRYMSTVYIGQGARPECTFVRYITQVLVICLPARSSCYYFCTCA